MYEGVRAVLLAGIYSHGTIDKGFTPDPLINGAFSLVSLSPSNPIPDEIIGQQLRAQWAGVNALKNAFDRLQEIKSEDKVYAGTFLSFKQSDKELSLAGALNGTNKATTTGATWDPMRFKVLKTGTGSLSQVVITNSTAGIINFYDATTTGSHIDHATTTIGIIEASAGETTYFFDAGFSRGLVAEWGGNGVASSTILWQ
ncbi:hypothetical protein DAPPUDRAFT_121050 [Daphnia pulex]|uniref:Uncharacterized protein n=1 Tax=Daphnia pulex TaxID=6669 RepID=E9I2N2_DAPPU|nr:hypothetical protein DAPPUDRAFT_121050 [Daphnia pulex]|eukprot:EFX61749.1 hypothetical protein DAPPUDRAFT_121050 [Daphnia pulex]